MSSLAVDPSLEPVLPHGLRGGSCVALDGEAGQTSLLFSLLSHPLRSGSWAVLAGFEHLGYRSAHEYGVPLERLATISPASVSPVAWFTAVGVLIDSFDFVVLNVSHRATGGYRIRSTQVSKLMARARQRSSVVLVMNHVPVPEANTPPLSNLWPHTPDVVLRVHGTTWQGINCGHGVITATHAHVTVSGRRIHPAPLVHELAFAPTAIAS